MTDTQLETWTNRLWAPAAGVYGAILEHPFLAGLTTGELDERSFAYYVAQDAHYLRDYARALAIVGAKAPSHADTGLFAKHAAQTVEVELALHETLLGALGLDAAVVDATPVSPTTTAHTSYLLSVTYGASFAEGLAAVLPCYWIYQRVGTELLAHGSPDPRYQRWIDTYGGEEFSAVVAEVLDLADRVGAGLPAAEQARAERHFLTTSRYEWMFWDAAWRREGWPV
jgi:thiaminase/transcriptional activator TenA